ncbi:MAG TPA: protein translocase subunit SecD [Gaiellaceae bacterium]|nr:protein translocase subunit SecD [Gaiellaceae bacterium]
MAERRSHLLLLGLIVAALVGAALLAVPGSPIHKKPVLGLDLQGGTEVVLKAVPPRGEQVTSEGMDTAQSVMRRRVDKLGVTEPEIRKQGNDQMVIELAGVNPERAQEVIGKTARLELFDLQGDLLPPTANLQGDPTPLTSLYKTLTPVQSQGKAKDSEEFYLFAPEKKPGSKTTQYKLVAGPMPTEKELLASGYVRKHGEAGEIPKGHKVLFVPGSMALVRCTPEARYCPNVGPPNTTYYYLFKYHPHGTEDSGPIPEMTGSDLNLKGTRQDFGTQGTENGQPIVLMDFTHDGAKKFQEVTRTLAERGRTRWQTAGSPSGQQDNFAQQFAIVLDREIKSAPTVSFQDNPNGIPGNNGAEITGIGSVREAKDLALVLQTGALPYNFRQLEKTEISATLGKDSLHEAKRAAIGGLILVALFLLIFYRFLGLVAVIGLGIYAAFLYAALLLFNVTLTLPGFAGLILTIGVAADANVVIFERIKEEVRAGKSVRAGISAGYAKGFHTIIDANVVTAITALVLFLVATAGVKGFALMLLIGTAISLVTAVFATRAMLGLLAGFKWFENPAFMGAKGQQHGRWLQIDFMGKRRLWFAISGVVIAVAIVSLGARGLNWGIDFKGGSQVTFQTAQPQLVDDVRSDAQNIDPSLSKAVIQGRGASTDGKYKSFQLRTKALSPAVGTKLRDQLESKLGATHYGATTVSESFGRQIAKSAGWAIFGSLLLIVLYLAIRFDYKYAIPVMAALIHDIVITVGVYSLTGREVTSSTVAAVLTVLGYSIYDTIIIFDRIRENVPLMRRASFATIANISLWETIRRSLATTFITLLPVMSLFVFGGATLKDFAFALLVGIASGAYSSIFIAAPLLTILKEREPEWAAKKGQGPLAEDGAAMEAVLAQDEAALAAEPEPVAVPELAPTLDGGEGNGELSAAQSKRERRRQRRRTRPHGRR